MSMLETFNRDLVRGGGSSTCMAGARACMHGCRHGAHMPMPARATHSSRICGQPCLKCVHGGGVSPVAPFCRQPSGPLLPSAQWPPFAVSPVAPFCRQPSGPLLLSAQWPPFAVSQVVPFYACAVFLACSTQACTHTCAAHSQSHTQPHTPHAPTHTHTRPYTCTQSPVAAAVAAAGVALCRTVCGGPAAPGLAPP